MKLPAANGFAVTLFGGFEIRLPDGALADLPGQKDRALLAMLVVGTGEVHSRERLAGLLWGDHGERQARDSLRQSLVRLRRCLGGGGSDGALRTDRQSVALDRGAVNSDVQTFEGLVRTDTVDSLLEATKIYRGDLLDGIAVRDRAFEDWLLVERQRLRQLFERALTGLMTRALSSGDRERAGDAARRLLQVDPLSEAAHRTLMQIQADDGQSALALKLYESLCERLQRELGVPPEPATVALQERIRQQRRSLSPAAQAGGESAPAAADRPPAAPSATKPSVAVLPFVNLGGDPKQDYFSDGITEDIITELSRFRTLLVIARNSSFQYRGGNLSITRIGRELGVQYVVEGSVRRIGDRVRISAQLIEAATGSHLWAENDDRDAADILAVQDDIVRAIATTLGYRVEAAGRERALRLSPEALSAYDLTLRSEALFLRSTKDDNIEARRLAQRAVELDPKSAPPYWMLGWTYCNEHLFGWAAEHERPLDTAFVLAQRAVLLDDADCRARWLLGYVHLFRREFDEARAQLRKALALNPNDVEARAVYAVYLNAVGESDAALEQFDIAKRQNPFEFDWVIVCRGIALFTQRRCEEAIATLKQLHNPNTESQWWLTASYAASGHLREARATLTELLATAEREMGHFPGRRLEDWKGRLHALVEYRDLRQYEPLFDALRAAGLE
jgi:TolB-like protein/Flp pilus assembly protein TadD